MAKVTDNGTLRNGEILDVAGLARLFEESGKPRSEKAIYHDVASRKIPHRRHGGRIFFRRTEIESWWAALSGCDVDEAIDNARRER